MSQSSRLRRLPTELERLSGLPELDHLEHLLNPGSEHRFRHPVELAGAVRPKKTEGLSSADLEAHAANSLEIPVALGEKLPPAPLE